jgi:hypothetical protein
MNAQHQGMLHRSRTPLPRFREGWGCASKIWRPYLEHLHVSAWRGFEDPWQPPAVDFEPSPELPVPANVQNNFGKGREVLTSGSNVQSTVLKANPTHPSVPLFRTDLLIWAVVQPLPLQPSDLGKTRGFYIWDLGIRTGDWLFGSASVAANTRHLRTCSVSEKKFSCMRALPSPQKSVTLRT